MADQQANAVTAAFPSPPSFYEHFTQDNIERIEALRKEAAPATGQGSKEPVWLDDLSDDLRYLQPPEPPAEGTYRVFGDFYTLEDALPSLEASGVEQLYTPPSSPGGHLDRAFILKRIAKSLLLNFLELMGAIAINPSQYAEKVADIRILFINFHHLLNEYRPHQARESLILTMEGQLARSRAETKGIERMKEQIEGLLRGLGDAAGNDEADVKTEGADTQAESVDATSEVWDELRREFA